ncbi:MAG: hypothetical protein EOO40_07685, partial [Deltaproteobacteria bacterium]
MMQQNIPLLSSLADEMGSSSWTWAALWRHRWASAMGCRRQDGPAPWVCPAVAPTPAAERWRQEAIATRRVECLAREPLLAQVGSGPDVARAAVMRGDLDLAIELFDALVLDDRSYAPELFELFAQRRLGGDMRRAYTLFARGEPEATEAAVVQWGGCGPLSPYLLRALLRYHSPQSINPLFVALDRLRLTEPLRQQFRRAALEVMLPLHSPRVPRSASVSEAFDCLACGERRGGEQAAVLQHCRCSGPTLCVGCMGTALAVDHRHSSCPTGCGAGVTRQDCERYGLPAASVAVRLDRILRTRLNSLLSWVWCETPDCMGGRQLPAGVVPNFHCGNCHATTRIGPAETLDPQLFRWLLEGLQAAPNVNGEHLYRECYHCGVPSEKGAGCLHMQCSSCGCDWDFEQGRSDRQVIGRRGVAAQQYRPLQDGQLARQGFYVGIPRGRLSP